MSDKHLQPGETRQIATVFDSAATIAKQAPNGKVPADAAESLLKGTLPPSLDRAMGKLPEHMHSQVFDAVLAGQTEYMARHGRQADPSLIAVALQRLESDLTPIRELVGGDKRAMSALDSASNMHHDQLSLQPAAAILAVMQMFAEAHTHMAYLPTDTKSNEARLMIGEHRAGSNFGDYTVDAPLNGISSGGIYFEGERFIDLGAAGGASFNTTVTVMSTGAVSASNPAVKLLRGRTKVLINGRPAAAEAENQGGTGPNAMAGNFDIGGTTYSIAGSSNSDTGDITFTVNPALPAGNSVHVMPYIDYERAPELAPAINFTAYVKKLYAHASRGRTEVSMDAMTQFTQEAGLDARGQLQLGLRQQFAAERWYKAHHKLLAIGKANRAVWDYDFSAQIAQKDYGQLWLNLGPILFRESQKMAERNIDHGIDTLFVTGTLSAKFQGLPAAIWQSSGITNRPGVYRLGRLFGTYDVYYVPQVRSGLVETGGAAGSQTSQMLAVGRGSSVARNPLVGGDAVPAMLLPLAFNGDLITRDGFYTRSFTEINPHTASQDAAVVIDVINMG